MYISKGGNISPSSVERFVGVTSVEFWGIISVNMTEGINMYVFSVYLMSLLNYTEMCAEEINKRQIYLSNKNI